jgi:hypothetical protein
VASDCGCDDDDDGPGKVDPDASDGNDGEDVEEDVAW